MKRHLFNKAGWFAVVATLIATSPVRAVDLAGASGTLADIATLSSQASAALAAIADSGDLQKIADAQSRADAIKDAMVKAEAAYADAENAMTDEAANDAIKIIADAFNEALEALNGSVPESSNDEAFEKWKESKTNTGGGPYEAWMPPTKDIDPLGGDSEDFGDMDATPQ